MHDCFASTTVVEHDLSSWVYSTYAFWVNGDLNDYLFELCPGLLVAPGALSLAKRLLTLSCPSQMNVQLQF